MGKASKLRACPAVGRDISSAECGASRISLYTCPADCPHLPFAPANYTQLLEIEERLDRRAMDFLIAGSTDKPAMERALEAARYQANPHALHAFYEWNLFFARGTDGRSAAERGDQSPDWALKNDERVLHRAKMKTRVALLEIREVLDDERINAADLLSSGAPAIRLHDRSLAATATRFAVALTWVFPLPHYWRLSGTGILIPALGRFEPREIVTEIVSHLGGPITEPEMRVWLAGNFVRFDEALMATCRLRRMEMMAGVDAKFGKAIYELQAPFGECRKRVDELSDVEPDDLSAGERMEGFAEARVWFAETPVSKQAVPPGGRPVLGRVLLGQGHWRLEAMGAKNLAGLRERFETEFGSRARFTSERLDDLGASLAADEPAADRTLAPTRLLEDPQQILLASSRMPPPPRGVTREQTEAELLQVADRQFLDEHIPALDNRTPREAAADPALRPRLIRLLKERVRGHDERNLRTGRNDDINWLLRELGADEILFNPPPWRPPPEQFEEDDAFEDAAIEGFTGGPGLPPAPVLPAEPLDMEEADRRLDAGMAPFETAADAFASLEACGVTILDDVDELMGDRLDENEYAVAITFILQAVLALVPPGHHGPPTSFESLERGYITNLGSMLERMRIKRPEEVMSFLTAGPQPHLMLALTGRIMKIYASGPKAFRPRPETQFVILALVKAVVEELDRALRL
jgi:hypothetical protein